MPPHSTPEKLPIATESITQFDWQIAALDQVMGQVRGLWARALRISSPQWLILNAIFQMDRGEGVPVKDVAKRIFVDPSFVTTQTKVLEKQGLVRRRASKFDARVVEMSLTDKAAKQIDALSERRLEIERFAFSDIGDKKLKEIVKDLNDLKKRLEQAVRRYPVELDDNFE